MPGRTSSRPPQGEDEDPLTRALAPPPDETPEAREIRLEMEETAKKVSAEIDESINVERAARRKRKKPVRVLLLGQSESGKSATLKNFQLAYAKKEWVEERANWKAVIQLNLIRNITEVLGILSRELDTTSSSDEDEEHGVSATNEPKKPRASKLTFGENHKLLKLRLAPLARVQQDLQRRLGAASSEIQSSAVATSAVTFDGPAPQEFGINSQNGWKSALSSLVRTCPEFGPGSGRKSKEEEADEATEIIASCREDIMTLYSDPTIVELLGRRKARIEDSPGFFLGDAHRIATRNYQPTDDDVVRSRLRTLGVQEYTFIFDHGRILAQEWVLYDVGGTRTSRAAWYPYFQDIDAIIFLAPISCFNEKLSEDRRVNRLEDSYLLWRSVCACKLLVKAQFILFLNKCDLLQAKLRRGVQIRDYVPSYANRSNDIGTACKYFQQHFKEISKQHSPVPRQFLVHLTSVIDTRSTAATLSLVEESILRDHLRHADLM